MIDAPRLHNELRAAGIPIDGLCHNSDGTVRIDFQPSATPDQKTKADEIVDRHDKTDPPDRKLQEKGYGRLQAATLLVLAEAVGGPKAPDGAKALVLDHARDLQTLW